jgi:hypothetical protein
VLHLIELVAGFRLEPSGPSRRLILEGLIGREASYVDRMDPHDVEATADIQR